MVVWMDFRVVSCGFESIPQTDIWIVAKYFYDVVSELLGSVMKK